MTNIRLTFCNCIHYLPLLQNLIARELKKKYRRSVLGYVWCVLNPLAVMLIMNFVFSEMFRNNIENFPVYLFAGRMIFSFVTDSTASLSRSIINNGSLMRKTRIPYYIFPLSNFCTSVVNLAFTMIAFAIVLIFTGTPITIHVLYFPVLLLGMFMFCFGLGLFLSQANTFVRDVTYLYNVFITAWLYVTPIFYPIENLPDALEFIITHFNPAFFYVHQCRMIFLYHQWPTTELTLLGLGCGFIFLLLGLFTYARSKDKLILYI